MGKYNNDNLEDTNHLLRTCPICQKYKVAYNAKICPGCGGDITKYFIDKYSEKDDPQGGCAGCLLFLAWFVLIALMADIFHWNTLLSFIVSTAIIVIIMAWREVKKDE